MNIIFIIGIFLSLFQFVLLLNKKSKSLPDGILAAWMMVISIHLLSYYLYYQGYWDEYPHLVGITVPFPFFYGPLLYLYVLYSIKNETQLRQKDYLHFAPIIIAYLYMFRFYFFYSLEEKRLVDKGLINDFDTFSNVLLIAFVASGVAYTMYSYRLLNQHTQLIHNNFSNTERINLHWLRSFIWGVGIIFLTVIVVLITRNIMGFSYPFNPDYIFYSMLVLAILALGYSGIRHQNIFVDNVVVEVEEKPKESYTKSGLKEDQANKQHASLTEFMAHQKPYLEPKLTLHTLAKRLDISPNHLSQIINQFEGQNFNDFVNKYRVEEFIKRAASNDKNLTLLALALESGFNSKSTFNAVFKKQKGATPSKFMSTHTK